MRSAGAIRRPLGLVLGVWLATAGAAFAGESTAEFWPEVDLWMRLSPAWRISTFVALSSNVETHYREGGLILQADYAWGAPRRWLRSRMLDEGRSQTMKAWLFRWGVLRGLSLGDQGEEYRERAILLELHRRIPIRGGVLLSHRLRADLRWLGDEDTEFSTRWRYRLMSEREFARGWGSLVPFSNVEGYYDSRYDTINRVRAVGGVSAAWSPRWALEGNVTYQHDTRSSVEHLYALNVILHAFLESSRSPSR